MEDSDGIALTPILVFLENVGVESRSLLCLRLEEYRLLKEKDQAPYEVIAMNRLSQLQVSFIEKVTMWLNGFDGNPMETRLSEHETEIPIGFIHFIPPADRAAIEDLLGKWSSLDELTKITHIMEASFHHTHVVLIYLSRHLPA